jgi:hypothetical protein
MILFTRFVIEKHNKARMFEISALIVEQNGFIPIFRKERKK